MDIEEKLNEENKAENNSQRSIAQSELVVMVSGYLNKIITNSVVRLLVAKTIQVTAIVLSVMFIFSFFLYFVPAFQEMGKRYPAVTVNSELKNDPEYKKQISALSRDVLRLTRKFSSFTPGQSYLVINTTDNRFTLYRNKKPVREGLCSSGSYTRLSSAEGNRHWIFKTPKGQFWIQQKIVKPLWIRPDWAFVEEGLPVPPANDESRFEYGVLGDYAMSLGDGYLIHGTIYTRAMGMPVTHGCVRLGDEDLEAIFNTLNIGSKVFIF
jgi:lipoprotein-anchoring transpeptidase ErfK/SrfK